MFEDFGKTAEARGGRKRFGASLAVSALVYGALAAVLVAATAAAKHVVEEEELTQVEFAPPPEPEPPPPKPEAPPPEPKPQQKARAKVQRKELEPPKEIPDEKLKESDAELAKSDGPSGPLDGFLDGVPGGTGNAPAPPPPPKPEPKPKPRGPVHLPENASPPVLSGGPPAPAYPSAAKSAGKQDIVIAKVVVHVNGTVGRIQILRGDPIFHQAVREWLSSVRFTPAKLPDGTAIEVFRIIKVPFRLTNM